MRIFNLIFFSALACGAAHAFGNTTYNITNKYFPKNFLFGVATAAYQYEGGWDADGKGESMWDKYFHENANRSFDGANGDVTCDGYHKWEEDIQNLKDLGVNFYRFSISWPRILPDGTTRNINQKGIEYYLNILKALKAANIEPVVTLYHWDLPEHLNQLGGWLNPQIAEYFGAYARVCFQYFGEYVKYWGTVNEPKSTCLIGYGSTQNAPGLPLIGDGVYQCAYTQLLAHATAYHIYDKEFRSTQNGKVTINLDHPWSEPRSNKTEDIEAAERENQFSLGWYANPIWIGNWPQVMIDRIANRSKLEGYTFSRLPELTQKEIKFIKGTSDFFSINVYTGLLCNEQGETPIGTPSYRFDDNTGMSSDPSWPSSSTDWLHAYPDAMRKNIQWIHNTYNPKEIFVSENGWPDSTGALDDQDRITYIQSYMSKLLDAIVEDGINVIGYTAWSFMDLLEWNSGHTQRLGLIHVDFNSPNKTRTWKSSAYWYKKVISTRCLLDHCEE